MADLHVTIEEIKEVIPHSNADKLEIIQVLGWMSIVSKGLYQAGDVVVYVPVDSVIPQIVSDKLGVTQYLGKNGRVRAARLRGEVSYGLIIPISFLENYGEIKCDESGNPLQLRRQRMETISLEIGTDLSQLLGISKYEPPQQLFGGDMEREHSLFHKYTDIDNYRNFPNGFGTGEEVIVTEKIHGCLDFDTLITTDKGPVKIGELVESELQCNVLTFDVEEGDEQWSPIVEFSSHQEDLQWYDLELEDGTAIRVTENHYIWLPEQNCYRKVVELREGDTLLVK